MNLLLNPQGGMAGDMFAAALISAGADEKEMINAMESASNKIGESSINVVKTHDHATRLCMQMKHNHGHLAASKARVILLSLMDDLIIKGIYKDFGCKILEILIRAEKQAHAENTFLTDHHHAHSSHHSHNEGGSDHYHVHDHEEAWLHEAQDVIVDIIGAAKGLQLLKAPVEAKLLKPVSLGGGRIKFSHGEMDVPAPATKIIMDKYSIPSLLGPIDVELCTPTGSAILAALNTTEVIEGAGIGDVAARGASRGGKDLDIPPLRVFLM